MTVTDDTLEAPRAESIQVFTCGCGECHFGFVSEGEDGGPLALAVLTLEEAQQLALIIQQKITEHRAKTGQLN